MGRYPSVREERMCLQDSKSSLFSEICFIIRPYSGSSQGGIFSGTKRVFPIRSVSSFLQSKATQRKVSFTFWYRQLRIFSRISTLCFFSPVNCKILKSMKALTVREIWHEFNSRLMLPGELAVLSSSSISGLLRLDASHLILDGLELESAMKSKS